MFAGMWVSENVHLAFVQSLAERGIPLDLGKTVAVIGVFLILFPIIRMFFIDPLAEAIGNRTNELERTFSEAENLRHEMRTMRNDYEARITETEAKAREQIQQQVREAQELRKTLMAEASQKADDLIHKAREEIERDRERVLTQLRLDMAGLALGAAEKVIGENMDDDRNRRLIEDFLASSEASSR